MMRKCRYLRQRSKKGQLYYYCVKSRKIVDFGCFRGCSEQEYKPTKTLNAKMPIKKVNKTNKVTKATSISLETKKAVWERDKHKCIFCGKEVSIFFANSHYIKRSQLGKGIEQNIMTNCIKCHNKFESSKYRNDMLDYAKRYFISKYDDWSEEELIYKKYKEKG